MAGSKKKDRRRNLLLDFVKSRLTDKRNVSPAARFIKAQEKKKAMLKKMGYWLDFSRTFIPFGTQASYSWNGG